MEEIVLYTEKEKQSGRWLISGVGVAVAAILLCVVCGVLFILGRYLDEDTEAMAKGVSNEVIKYTFVIDAGHGGMDSGAVSEDGTLEKNLNLAVSKRLAALLRAAGVDFVMTRTDDSMLVSDSVKEKRKMHDLKNRLSVVTDLADSGTNAIFVSIHMNKFTSSKYSGLQVWYSKNHEDSEALASKVQEYAKTWLDSSNGRQIKPATSAIYLLDRATVPAILIECGFLSNNEECVKLQTADYQNALAVTIFSALCSWTANK